ncbi:TauD/TfdA family dioxygenase [Gandjariella thermophila]|uniref:Protein AmbC n=1 Tax=Gandjariella thermophila TaxID=1931992 RepID=A0A4D4IZ31_9PSEU|nr:TauD/TfdA family dioxygenase [Gandjariella thermophila]GDY29605.1 protein AmbC [Gandjariella thermophila]
MFENCSSYGEFPLFVHAKSVSDPAGWAKAHAAALREALHRHGAVLLRGFPIESAGAFQEVVRALSGGEWSEYKEKATPRSHVAGSVFTSTEYPADRSIFVHNESSHVLTWPRYLYFWCDIPAEQGGETPVCDTRTVYRELPAEIRDRFEREGWIYQRTFGEGIGFDWRSVFGVRDVAELDRYCAANNMSARWHGDRLTVRYRRWATMRHPDTGVPSWFNHGVFFNRWNLEPELQEFAEELGEDSLPYHTFHGNGEEVPRDVIEEIRRVYDAATVAEPYRHGDVLVVDNVAAAHGRRPYRGDRRILVTMTDTADGRALSDARLVETPEPAPLR